MKNNIIYNSNTGDSACLAQQIDCLFDDEVHEDNNRLIKKPVNHSRYRWFYYGTDIRAFYSNDNYILGPNGDLVLDLVGS